MVTHVWWLMIDWFDDWLIRWLIDSMIDWFDDW
jgi:hypothetical protein